MEVLIDIYRTMQNESGGCVNPTKRNSKNHTTKLILQTSQT